MRKKLLLVAVCVALLLGAVGAYSYIEISGLQSRMDSLQETVSTLETYVSSLEDETARLQSEVSTLESQIDALQDELAHKNSTKTFNFYWEGIYAEYFNVTMLWMNITLERVEHGNLTYINMTVELNDMREDYWGSYVGVVSDFWGSDRYYMNGQKQQGGLGDYYGGQRFIDLLLLWFDTWEQNVRYDPDFGVTYIIQSEPLEWVQEWAAMENATPRDMIHVEYAHEVAVEFCFGMELIA